MSWTLERFTQVHMLQNLWLMYEHIKLGWKVHRVYRVVWNSERTCVLWTIQDLVRLWKHTLLWNRSTKKLNLGYKYMICDGDSISFLKVECTYDDTEEDRVVKLICIVQCPNTCTGIFNTSPPVNFASLQLRPLCKMLMVIDAQLHAP